MSVDPKRDIWGALINENKDNKKSLTNDKHFLFVGGQKSGKTSLQYQFFSRREDTQPTIAVSYQSSLMKHEEKEIQLHLWEIGSGTSLEQLLNVIITDNEIPNLTIFIAFEMDRPSSILDAIEWGGIIQNHFGVKVKNVYFIGTFYDKFLKNESMQKLNVLQGMRAVANKYHAGLMYTSYKDDSLCNKFRSLVRAIACGENDPITADPDAGGNEIISPFVRQAKALAAEEEKESVKEEAFSAKFASTDIDDDLAAKDRELDEKLRVLRANLNTSGK